MLWTMTDNVALYYDGVCAWLIYGRKGSLTRCETLVPLEKPPGEDYGVEFGPHRVWADEGRLVTWEHTKW